MLAVLSLFSLTLLVWTFNISTMVMVLTMTWVSCLSLLRAGVPSVNIHDMRSGGSYLRDGSVWFF